MERPSISFDHEMNRSAAISQRQDELNVESLSLCGELASVLPEIPDGQGSLEARELRSDGVDRRLVQTGEKRRVGARRRRHLPLAVAGDARPAAEETALRPIVAPQSSHEREGIARRPVHALLLAVDV